MSEAVQVPADLRDAPASVKLVWLALDRHDDPLTKRTLADQTQLTERTVKAALHELRCTDWVAYQPHPPDGRKHEYYLTE